MVSLDGDAMTPVFPPRTSKDAAATLSAGAPSTRRRYVIVLLVALCAVGLFLIAMASASTALFAQHYRTLLVLNGTVAVLLAALVIWQLMTLRRKLKAGVFGAKLTLRLVLLFALMAVVPGVLLYGMSIQFLGKSIESWFDVKVDKALEGGLKLSQDVLDNMLQDLKAKGSAIAFQLSTRPTAEQAVILNSLREQAGVTEATLFTGRGRIIQHAGAASAGVAPEAPPAAALRLLRSQQVYAQADATPERGLLLRVVAPVNVLSLAEEPRALQLVQVVPQRLAQHAETVQFGYREYQELVLGRKGLKRLYGITLTLTLLLSVLAALAAAFLLSEELSAPLIALVEGTRAVAQGDYSRRAVVSSRDELGLLMQSFNSMTGQLEDARSLAERNQAEVVQSKAYLESILAHLSAGVLVFDEKLSLRSANPSASAILGLKSEGLLGLTARRWGDVDSTLAVLGAEITNGFVEAGDAEWERQAERKTQTGEQHLLLRGKRLPRGVRGADSGFVVVFDDVTHVLQAQRDAAWAEVARRLAHEIKNPLTPIQLSAERLQMKLAPKLEVADAGMLSRSTQTIVNQVAALKRMVDAFSQYARAPEPTMRELDLNALVHEVLTLYESLGSSIKLDLADTLPPIVGDAAQLRQVIHNLLQNAQDALGDAPQPAITVTSALGAGDNTLRFSVTDNGSGFPEHLMKRAFEPYVTTKAKGTGLGLVIVKKIIEEHGGSVAISNVEPHGARVLITLPVAQRGVLTKTAA
jgi:PAS domain S-box-containing protein